MHLAPYTVTNSYKGGLFMRTYARNVRRAWDADDYYSTQQTRAPKRLCTTDHSSASQPTITFNTQQHHHATAHQQQQQHHPHANENDEDTLERAIRETSVAISSSPSRKNSTIFSLAGESLDDNYISPGTDTPPSSPLPPQRLSPPVIKVRKPTFACLNKDKKRKRATSTTTRDTSEQPLSEVVNSSFGGRASASASGSVPPPAKKQQTQLQLQPPPLVQPLVQMRLDLGGDVRKSCAECGMEYIPSNEEDATLHKMYHNMDRDGVELGKAFMKSAMKWAYEMKNIEGCVVIVDRKISLPARKVVQKVLGIVNKELAATEIDDETLWSQRALEDPGQEQGVKKTESEKRNYNKSDRYKVFLHVKDGKCVGMCLAERITTAHRVKPVPAPAPAPGPAAEADKPSEPTGAPHSSSIEVEDETVAAVVGVSRIWTSKAFRRKGIAQNLLDCVLNHFVYGMEVEREELAFSQPTESGGLLARAWYGEESGLLVYREE